MSEQMSDEDLGRAIDEAGSSIPKDAINPATGKPFGTGNVPAMHAAMGAAARRLVHEDDALAMIERLTAERDAALAEIEIWKSVFPDIAPDRVLPDRAQAEAEAFRAGAEAMRKACASAVKNEELEGPYDNGEDMAYDVAIGHAVEAIRALPIPDHQSSTQTGTNATTGHS